ncbi:ankyrin repeat domain-containing protein [Paraburkholderia hayleyella]|uniref:ankyrin repeat domain-containing protein n=1 Tax=Paraburkholderia hayleyella TaxID=2152889 RepID=UPI001291F28F|nr:ankyrin repeat domain-containing protein [Paraburkholderia hayleyella]
MIRNSISADKSDKSDQSHQSGQSRQPASSSHTEHDGRPGRRQLAPRPGNSSVSEHIQWQWLSPISQGTPVTQETVPGSNAVRHQSKTAEPDPKRIKRSPPLDETNASTHSSSKNKPPGHKPLYPIPFDGKGKPFLNSAIEQCDYPAAKFLLNAKISPRLTDRKGRNALHVALKTRSLPIINQVLRHDPSTANAPDHCGNTPFHHAILKHNDDVIWLFRNYGADPTMKNHDGLTPANFVVNQAALSLLKNSQANAHEEHYERGVKRAEKMIAKRDLENLAVIAPLLNLQRRPDTQIRLLHAASEVIYLHLDHQPLLLLFDIDLNQGETQKLAALLKHEIPLPVATALIFQAIANNNPLWRLCFENIAKNDFFPDFYTMRYRTLPDPMQKILQNDLAKKLEFPKNQARFMRHLEEIVPPGAGENTRARPASHKQKNPQ